MTPPTKKVLLWIGSPGAMSSASMTRVVREHFRGDGVWPPTQNGWAVPPPKDKHTSLPKVKGRREGVEDTIEEGTSDGIPEHEDALINSLGGTVGGESPSRGG
jgi:hypothetical protein